MAVAVPHLAAERKIRIRTIKVKTKAKTKVKEDLAIAQTHQNPVVTAITDTGRMLGTVSPPTPAPGSTRSAPTPSSREISETTANLA